MHHEEGDAYPMTPVLHPYSWQSEQKIQFLPTVCQEGSPGAIATVNPALQKFKLIHYRMPEG